MVYSLLTLGIAVDDHMDGIVAVIIVTSTQLAVSVSTPGIHSTIIGQGQHVVTACCDLHNTGEIIRLTVLATTCIGLMA